jgi:hypothetical protein
LLQQGGACRRRRYELASIHCHALSPLVLAGSVIYKPHDLDSNHINKKNSTETERTIFHSLLLQALPIRSACIPALEP